MLASFPESHQLKNKNLTSQAWYYFIYRLSFSNYSEGGWARSTMEYEHVGIQTGTCCI